MSSNVRSYFEKNVHAHSYHHEPGFYDKIKNEIGGYVGNRRIKILDIGCGDGYFLSQLVSTKIDAEFYGTDLSHEMLKIAQAKVRASRVELFLADAFNLPISDQIKFDIIHVDSVLHHLIAQTRSKSIMLAVNLLRYLVSMLVKGGVLVIEEAGYESYLFPTLTSSLIFYGCKLMNFLNLDLSSLIPELRPGLEVNFFSQDLLEGVLSTFPGRWQLFQKDPPRVPRAYRVFLLKELTHIVYIFSRD